MTGRPHLEKARTIMARTISTVKKNPTRVDDINALSQYIRSDLSKANGAIRRRDTETFRTCVDNISAYLRQWVREVGTYLEEAE